MIPCFYQRVLRSSFVTGREHRILQQHPTGPVEKNGRWCLGIQPSEITKTLSANPWRDNIIAYFKRSSQNQNQCIENGEPVFAADLFHQVLGTLLVVPHSDIEETTIFNITKYVLNLQERDGSFAFYPTNPQSEIAKISQASNAPHRYLRNFLCTWNLKHAWRCFSREPIREDSRLAF